MSVWFALGLLLAAGTACTVISSSSSTTRSGTQVSEETLTQLELGKTSKEWLIATLGPPTSASHVNGNTEILKYASTRKKKTRSGLILVVNTDSESEEKETVYFEFTDGILKRYWKAT